MPIFDVPIKEFVRHILHPFVVQRVKTIVNSLNLEDVIKDNIHIKYGFSTGTHSKDQYKNVIIRNNRVDVDVELNMNPLSLKWDSMSFAKVSGYGYTKSQLAMERAVFMDPEVGVSLHVHDMPCSVNLNINITVMSRNIAFSVMGMYYDMYNGEDNSFDPIDFMYDVPVNGDILTKLHDIYQMRRFDKTKLSFLGYLFAGSQCAISEKVNRTGTQKEVVLRRHRTHILQDVSMSAEKPQENNDGNGTFSYTIPLTLTSQFSRPNFFTLLYPITIMNQLIPARHIVTGYTENECANNVDFIKQQVDKRSYEYWLAEYKHFDQPFISPFYDDWKAPYESEQRNCTQRPFWIITVTLDEDEKGVIKPETPVTLVDYVVDKFRLHPIVEEIIGIQSCESYEPDCLFNIAIYKNDIQYDKSELGWDIDERAAVIKSTDRVGRYHLVISEMMDLNFLNPKWNFLVERYSDFFKKRNDNNNIFDNGGLTDPDGSNTNGDYIGKRVLYGDIIPVKTL